MAPNKTKRVTNGFMTFVQEWRQTDPVGQGMSLAQAVERCGDVWKVMTPEERSPYVEKAMTINLETRKKPSQIVQMDLALREAEERLEEMKRTTENMVLEAVEANGLENRHFVFISHNFFTTTVSGDLYVPAEFSACKFSLKQGIMSWYTTLINPGSLDLGQARDALHHSTTTHGLPLPPNALGERNMNKLYKNIHDYLTRCIGCKPLIVFTNSEDIGRVKASLDDLRVKSCHRGKEIVVLGIEYLLFCLKKQLLLIAGQPIDDIHELCTDSYVKKDVYEFESHISCKFHEDVDRTQFCSLSRVQRWGLITMQVCDVLNIPKKPGKHIPDPDPDPKKVQKNTCLAGFGRGRPRARLSTLGEANR
ncbi:protein maelstrom-like [Drosophila serrata]|uniref:protein maelstrom-like n=1 Tax=Drosophila serrata TaxID=7274 RepID=UPI000A1CF348|nr:protein maelstrom-like [Drosophila serrata]